VKVWLVSCGIFFLAVEVLQWAQEWVVPLPLYIIGGSILAIASNTDKGITTVFQQSQDNPVDVPSPPRKSPLPPKLAQPQRPISFKIKQPKSEAIEK
jgi:hypothetical protein